MEGGDACSSLVGMMAGDSGRPTGQVNVQLYGSILHMASSQVLPTLPSTVGDTSEQRCHTAGTSHVDENAGPAPK